MQYHPENDEQYQGLTVNSGVERLPDVNPYRRRVSRREYTVSEYVDGILAGNKVILSQAVTMIESSLPRHQQMAAEIVEKCLPHAGRSVRWGITGVPGAGKSTSIEAFGMELLRRGRKLAVLAIDPSSERSRGSILGDKTRMEQLSVQPDAFIRPSPSGGSLGGVARKTRETIVLCEAAGYDTIFVETVGVGQSETAVHSMVDFFLLIQIAGAGDELQGIKRGIMEMSDGIAINKADGDNLQRARLAAAHYRNALLLFPMPESGVRPQVLTYSALTSDGINEVLKMVEDHISLCRENGSFETRRRRQDKYWMQETIDQSLRNHFYQNQRIESMMETKQLQVYNSEITAFRAAQDLLDAYFDSLSKRQINHPED
ncbi:MAG: methylmalonyl Co-A mutase-associated GTPase MeaB [Bacteroidales bacterium]|nr:methylmalonyl Co-A mutase-associated GTPase MeaB [Bacteroidales bacterium]